MARKCKCKICKSELTSDKAFCVSVLEGGEPKSPYYCNEQEYRQEQSDIYFWKQCQYSTDDIFGYPIINNNRNKYLSEILKAGYSREELYDCIIEQSEYIKKCLTLRQDIQNENQKLAYMAAILKGSIRDITEKNKQKICKTVQNNQTSEIDMKLISDLIHTEETIVKQQSPKKQTLMDIIKKGGKI